MIPVTNQQITAAAWAAARGALPGIPKGPGLCLALVRVVVEAALEYRSHELYARHLVAGTTRRPGDDAVRLAAARLSPWASDFEASVKKLAWGVPLAERQPGDLIFNHNASPPFGHVGILLDRNTVLENIDHDYRPGSILLPNSLALTPLESRAWTLVARVQPNEGR